MDGNYIANLDNSFSQTVELAISNKKEIKKHSLAPINISGMVETSFVYGYAVKLITPCNVDLNCVIIR